MFSYTVGPDLELRLLEERHAEELFALVDASREHLRPWTPWIDGVKAVDDERAFIHHALEMFVKGDSMTMGIWYKGRLAGVISFENISRMSRSAAVGYLIGAQYANKGLTTRACKALVDYGFKELGFNRIEIWAATGNEYSWRIPEKLGFMKEGVSRQKLFLNGQFLDIVTYSMLRSEW